MSDPMAAPGTARGFDLLGSAVAVTQAAAVAASAHVGRRNREAISRAAATAMHHALYPLPIAGTVVIGEDMHGPAQMLQRGARIGTGGGPAVAVALDALDGARTAAHGGANATSVLAMAEGSILAVPDVVMVKIAAGPGLPSGIIDLDAPPEANLKAVADAKGVPVGDLVVCLLDRSIHDELFARIIVAGARTLAIRDGDISGIVATCRPECGVDLYMGSGGAPEGIVAAAALAAAGGQMQARMLFRTDEELAMARAWGIRDPGRRYDLGDLVSGRVVFSATGVGRGVLLPGVRRAGGRDLSHTIAIDSADHLVRLVEGEHPVQR